MRKAEQAQGRARIQNLSFPSGPVAVIGDIHGCAELLAALLEELDAIHPQIPIIVLGDVCDRGPNTKGVLDLLVARGARGVVGNHEAWFVGWVRGEGFDTFALNPVMGGEATLRSYGVEGRTPREVEEQRWRVPAAHREFLETLALVVGLDVGGERFWIVHAGVGGREASPGVDAQQVVPWLAANRPHDLLWRTNTPSRPHAASGTVIMGHIPLEGGPEDHGHTIAVDTGAGVLANGRLTAVVLPERSMVTVG